MEVDNADFFKRFETKTAAELKRSFGAALAGLVVSSVGLSLFLFAHHNKTKSAQDHITELKRVEQSLQELQSYVEHQQRDLKATSEQLGTLSKQKGDVENILSIDRPKVEALLTTMNKQSSKNRFIELMYSFVLGVFPSLTATFGHEWWRRSRSRNRHLS